MPDYDIWSPDRDKIGYIMNANNEYEALGRARERWKLPNNLLLVAILRIPADSTSEAINVGDIAHKAATSSYLGWHAAFAANNHKVAAKMERAYHLQSKAYSYIMDVADLVDSQVQAQARLDAVVQTHNTYSDPDNRPNLDDGGDSA